MKRVIRPCRDFTRLIRGVFGVGIGNSVQKLGFVPEAQNDMIFSIICEELGLAGAGIIVFLFLLLIWRFFLIASGSRDLLCADRDRSDGTYDDSGYFKYCSCDEHNSEYGDYTSF